MIKNIAVIPARSGSKRILNKNLRNLFGFPLIYYSINVAIKSRLFSKVYVSTDSKEIAEVSEQYGAEVPFLRPRSLAQDSSPDIEWVQNFIENIKDSIDYKTFFTILRPTNPCRKMERLIDAHNLFYKKCDQYDSLRAMRPISENPGKMWRVNEFGSATPVLSGYENGIPWHSLPTQMLPKFYIQNANLEITTIKSIQRTHSISGNVVLAWIDDESDGIDLNDESDWLNMIQNIKNRKIQLSDGLQ